MKANFSTMPFVSGISTHLGIKKIPNNVSIPSRFWAAPEDFRKRSLTYSMGANYRAAICKTAANWKRQMKTHQKSTPSEEVIGKRLQWLEAAYDVFSRGGAKAYLENQPRVDLLLFGLRESDPERWDIGIIDANAAFDPSQKGDSIIFEYEKPEERRESNEADSTDRQFDPPAALVQQLHILFGGRLRLKTSRSNVKSEAHPKGIPYHYPLISIPAAPSKRLNFRALRAILDAPSNKLATGSDEFRDMRRCKLHAPWLTQKQAMQRFGPQKTGNYHTRSDALKASMYSFDLNHSMVGCSLTHKEYHEALTRAYQLLDCHPLKPRDLM